MARVTRDSALEPLRHVGRVLLQKEETPTPTSRTVTYVLYTTIHLLIIDQGSPVSTHDMMSYNK